MQLPDLAEAEPVISKVSGVIDWTAGHLSGLIGLEQSTSKLIILGLIAVWITGLLPIYRYRKYSKLGFWIFVGIVYAIFTWIGI